jgi:hypothetical protein
MPLFFNKLICGLLITLLVVPTALFVAPKQAEAMPTMDPNTLMLVIKEYILDIIGWVMSELLLALTTSEIAEWANNNFGGMVLTYNEATGTFNYEWVNNDASFLASPDKFFTNLALGVGMHALEGTSPTFQTIFPDWDSTMLISLREDLMRLEQSFEERYRPTMDAADLENLFANLGEGGGWSAWLEMATNPQNNIHGALRLAREEATRQIQIAQSQTRDDLQQGGGFLTARNCVDVQPNHPDADIFGCLRYENVTPGSAIRGQVGQALGIDLEKKAQADEITEVIAQFIAGALLNLIEQGLSTIGSSTLSTYPITTSGSPEHSCPSTMNAEQCQAYLMEQAQAERERQIEEAREEYERERDRVVDEIRQPGDPGYVEPITQRTLTLTAQATSASNIHLAWRTNAPDGTEFQIFRRDSAGNFVQLPGSTDTSQTTTPLHRYVDARLDPNTTYTYFVRSVDGVYTSAEASATTNYMDSAEHSRIISSLQNVTNFTANAVGPYRVDLAWSALAGHSFRIYRDGQRITEVATGSTSFIDETVTHNTAYRYTITSVREGQESRMSPHRTVTTPIDPDAIGDFALAPINPNYPSWIPYPAFNANMVDDTVRDILGNSPRDYYLLGRAQLADSYWENAINTNDYRPGSRTGAVDASLLAYKLTGDLHILDQWVKLIKIWASNRTTNDGYIDWNGGHTDTAIDAQLVMGAIFPWVYIAKIAADNGIASPMGHDYRAFANSELYWFLNHFKPRWEAIRGTSGYIENRQQPFIDRPQHHTSMGEASGLYFIGLALNDQNYLRAARNLITSRFNTHTVCNVGIGGRTVRLWSHADADSTTGSSRSLQYNTYAWNEVGRMVMLAGEGVSPSLGFNEITQIANTYAAFPLDRTPSDAEPIAETIGGDRGTVCGRHIETGYRSRTVRNQAANRAPFALGGFDETGTIEAYLVPTIPYATAYRSLGLRSSFQRFYERYQGGWHYKQ